VQFRDTVLGPGSGQRPMRATLFNCQDPTVLITRWGRKCGGFHSISRKTTINHVFNQIVDVRYISVFRDF
jgi:hypothetical protein